MMSCEAINKERVTDIAIRFQDCDQIAKVNFVSIADKLGENVLGILNGL